MVSVGKWGEETEARVFPMHLAVAKNVSPPPLPFGSHLEESRWGEAGKRGQERGGHPWDCVGVLAAKKGRLAGWGEFRVPEMEMLEEAGIRKREAGEVRHEGAHGSQHRCCTHLFRCSSRTGISSPGWGKEAAPAATFSLSTPSGALQFPKGTVW